MNEFAHKESMWQQGKESQKGDLILLVEAMELKLQGSAATFIILSFMAALLYSLYCLLEKCSDVCFFCLLKLAVLFLARRKGTLAGTGAGS